MIKSVKYYQETASILGWGKSAGLDEERVELISKFITGKKILDIGCGFGLYVDYLSRLGYETFGVDFIEKFIILAKQSKQGIFIKADAEKLPFKDNEFDTLLMFDILEHGDDVGILKEAKRVCKNRILVIVPKKVNRQLEQSGVIFRHYLDKSHLREYTPDDFDRLAEAVGLKLTTLKAIHPIYNETVFLNLFKGSILLKKIIRKIVFIILPKKIYPTEYFAVFDK